MPVSLDRLPYDLLFYISASLDLDDIVHLGYTCRQLWASLNESTLCRSTIQRHSPHSAEAALARSNRITYREALQRIYDRRHSFSNAYPFSARVIGQASAFIYRQGVLCLLNGYKLQILDVQASSDTQREIDISSIIDSMLVFHSSSSNSAPKLSLLYYSDEIIAIHYERKAKSNDSLILAISTKDVPPSCSRLIECFVVETSQKLFVRHTSSYLYYGTYSAIGNHGHHEWVIQGFSFDKTRPLPEARPIQLEEFFGTDIGSTVVFEIHDGHFYAVSNQTSFDVEELDWTSFYHCVRFPLDKPLSKEVKVNKRIYRRQHAEGPIHDSWTDLSLQVDERTNKLLIVESRREWQRGSSKQLRTFYTQKIKFPKSTSSNSSKDGSSPTETTADPPLLPLDDPLVNMIDSSNNPNYAPEQERKLRYTHPEFGKPEKSVQTPRSFILARTKYRAYNFSCSSFIDVVEDEKCCMDPYNPNSGSCLRLRIGSRRPEPLVPIEDYSPNNRTVTQHQLSNTPIDSNKRDYRYSPIRMWPPPASTCPCAARLHRILNPPMPSGQQSKTILGVLDEQNLVYMVRPGRSYGGDDNALGTVVVVSFCRALSTSQSINPPRTSKHPIEDNSPQSEWYWRPGHATACRTGSC
jgi:hypothetical protein